MNEFHDEQEKELQEIKLNLENGEPLAKVSDKSRKWLENGGVEPVEGMQWAPGLKKQIYKILLTLFFLLVPVNLAMHFVYQPFFNQQVANQLSNDGATQRTGRWFVRHAGPSKVVFLTWLASFGILGLWLWPYIMETYYLNKDLDL